MPTRSTMMLIPLLAPLLVLMQDASAPAAPTAPTAPAVCDRIVVIGASASAGFGLGVGTKPTLARVTDVMLDRAPGTTRDFSSEMFFLAPSLTARTAIERALKVEP